MPTSPKVDSYIAKARPFAQPILTHLRNLVHQACPGVEETIKWSRPFFEHRGTILGNMSGFKEHCSFGFWGQEMGPILRKANAVKEGGMGTLGRIASLKDIPSDQQMLGWIRHAADSIESGQQISPIAARHRVVKPVKAPAKVPTDLTTALRKNKKAASTFAAFSPSAKREYAEWVAEAKRAETRDKRIATAVEWISQGKQRNWKYQDC